MNKKIAIVGNSGPKVRSDCQIQLSLSTSGGRQIHISSKVKSMFGAHIHKLMEQGLSFFDIKNCELKLEDRGALDFVLMARLEAAVKLLIDSKKEFLPALLDVNKTASSKEQFRFSRLYLPGNSPSLMLNAGVHQPNGLILDLEDSVAPAKKHEARFLVRNALRALRFYGAERMVRINQGEKGIDDLAFVVNHHVNCLLIPKCESGAYIKKIDEEISRLKKDGGQEYPIWYMPIIESAKGIEFAYEIATASPNVVALAIGLEDFTADLGVQRSPGATESFYARTRLVNACKAAGIQPIDSVFSDVQDMDGLAKNVQNSKQLGFEGMGCIHPRQIKVIHENFAPDRSDLDKAMKIVRAYIEAEKKGLGVVALGSKMIDPPVVKRAQKNIDLALKLKMIPENWLDEMDQE